KTLDYGTAQQLSLSIIEKLDRSRDEKSFEPLLETINNFCRQNSIIINDKPKQHRNQTISVTFKDSIVNSIIGQRDDNQNEEFYRTSIYYQLIDNILIELKDRFSLKNLQFLCGISTLSPDSDSFLHFESIKTFASHLNLNLDFLFNKLTVAKPMSRYKSLGNIIDLYQELLPFQEAFPVLVALIQMRNTTTDERLNDLCLLVAEHDKDGIFNTCSKPASATAQWWNTFVRIKDDNENIIPFVQCIKCFSIFAYESSKTGSSTLKAHAESCLGGGSPSSSKNQDIIVMMNKDNNSNILAGLKRIFTVACAKCCAYDLRPYESVHGHGFQILCQSLLDVAPQISHLIEAAAIIPDPTTISRQVQKLAESMPN
ncbi:unnamed protein product, partial [Rotaria magnacalcarata]